MDLGPLHWSDGAPVGYQGWNQYYFPDTETSLKQFSVRTYGHFIPHNIVNVSKTASYLYIREKSGRYQPDVSTDQSRVCTAVVRTPDLLQFDWIAIPCDKVFETSVACTLQHIQQDKHHRYEIVKINYDAIKISSQNLSGIIELGHMCPPGWIQNSNKCYSVVANLPNTKLKILDFAHFNKVCENFEHEAFFPLRQRVQKMLIQDIVKKILKFHGKQLKIIFIVE